MVGFKSVWPLVISLFLFGACVPQKKQTECGSNEAFNSQLRSCVPIVQGPSAFINISSFTPPYTTAVYKNDTTPITFNIAVSNPYNQSYTIEWDLTYNGLPDTIAGNVTSISIFPATYSTQIGSNIITAKVLDSNGKIVDSHNFEIVIQELPRPNINTGTLFPSDYTPEVTPASTGQRFSFIGRNNGAVGIANYRVFWTLSQNGLPLPAYAETDTFTVTSTNGENTFYYGSSTVPRFDPSTLGVGSYVLHTRIENTTSGEIVAQHQWNITVKDPDFGFVSSAGSPIPGTDTVAFFGVNYLDYPFANSSAATSRYCVTLSDPDGSYTNGSSVDTTNLDLVVRFYKNGSGAPIYEGRTDGSATPVKSQVCFDEASAAEQANLFFSDGSPVIQHYRTLVAKVFDEQTGREICGTGMPSCPVPYPISWNILVKPVDTGVTATFQNKIATDNIEYTSTGASTRTAKIIQNDAVTIRFIPTDGIAGYEGYDMRQATGAANSTHFSYDIVIKKLGVTIDTISCKLAADPFPYVAATNVQTCTFTWPAFHPVTGEHLDPGAYVATLVVTDDGSPVPGSIGTTSTALTLTTTVSEPVNGPAFTAPPDFITLAGGVLPSPVDEGTDIRLRVQVTEAEHDDYTLVAEYCGTDNSCAVPVFIDTDSRVFGDSQYSTNTVITHKIPENAIGSALTDTVYYRFTLTDSPTVQTGTPVQTTVGLNVANFNYLPVLTAASARPAAGTYQVFSGYQFSASVAAAISDASLDPSEQTTTFQWWIGTNNDINNAAGWTAIEGATTSTLKWTPGPELTGPRYLAVCYSDGAPRMTADDTNPPALGTNTNQRCFSQWTITPRSNAVPMVAPTGTANGEVALFPVPAEEIVYAAYAEDDKIYVEKIKYNTDGTFGKPMKVVSFPTLSGGASSQNVKNLSLTASDSSLYVAYLADSLTAPNSFRAHIRRINISNAASEGGEKTATAFAGSTGTKRKFDFNYTGISVTTSCAGSATNCDWDPALRTMTFDGTPINTSGTVTISQTINGTPVDTVIGVSLVDASGNWTSGTICGNCNEDEQAESFALAINISASTNIQGLTAFNSGSPVVSFFGMSTAATESWTSTQAITAMGKILYNSDSNFWYLPVANADLPGNQNKIQLLRGPDDDVSAASMITNNIFTLDAVSAIDNSWGATSQEMYIGYIRSTGGIAKVMRVTRPTLVAPEFASSTPRAILSSMGVDSISLSGPIGTVNPYVYVSVKDSADKWRLVRLNTALSLEVSGEMVAMGQDNDDDLILANANISQVRVEPARPTGSATTSSEGRVVVVSNGLGSSKSYLFRWKTNATILDATDSFDSTGEETSANSQIATFAPMAFTFGDDGHTAGEKTNPTMAVLRLRTDGQLEASFLNTDVESINSTTTATTGEFRTPYVK